MIGRSEKKRENYPGKCFQAKEKETHVKIPPWVSTNQPSNNWAQGWINSAKKASRHNSVADETAPKSLF